MGHKLCENLKFYRKQLGMTQAQVAEAVGINRSTYTYYEKGTSAPNIAILVQIAQLFEVDYAALIDDETPVYKVAQPDLSEQYPYNESLLSEDEKELLRCFRVASDEQKRELLSLAEKFDGDPDEV